MDSHLGETYPMYQYVLNVYDIDCILLSMAVELVLSSLQNAGSQDPLAIRQAEEQLRQWEVNIGF